MDSKPDTRLWSAVLRVERPSAERLRVRLPLASPERATWMVRELGYGRRAAGAVVFQGRAIATILKRLGFGGELVGAAREYARARGFHERLEAASAFWELWIREGV